MENKINIAELLKNCPKGMELDCALYEDVYFDYVGERNIIRCYIQHEAHKTSITFNQYGIYGGNVKCKCVIFPKGKTTWEGFVPPCQFKDGDILATDLGSVFFLNTRLNTDEYYGCYVGIGGDGSFHICEPFAYKECCGLATEEEKQIFFDALKAKGYKWNEETKTLDELIDPMFKVGDIIQDKDKYEVKITEVNVEDECYEYESKIAKGIGIIGFARQDDYELVSNKFDITTLKPFDKVLVRDSDYNSWHCAFYSHYKSKKFYIVGCSYYYQCIPYEGNEHLLGTTEDCAEFYKTW
jgi:hypothetical protein